MTNSPLVAVEIDHIVLTDVGVTPGRAFHLQAHLEAELPRLLASGLPATPAEAAVVAVGPVPVTGIGDGPLAAGIARGIVQAVGDRDR